VFPNNLSIPVGNQSIKLMGFVATDVNYYYETSNLKDAHFLCAILNSSVVSKMIEPLMSKGFGGAPRDIHKKPFELSIPVFDKTNKQHLKLAEISLLTEKKVEKFLRTNPPAGDITPGTIGGYRNKVRAHVKEELAEIDKIVAGILK
jgi:hypothetical protein